MKGERGLGLRGQKGAKGGKGIPGPPGPPAYIPEANGPTTVIARPGPRGEPGAKVNTRC